MAKAIKPFTPAQNGKVAQLMNADGVLDFNVRRDGKEALVWRSMARADGPAFTEMFRVDADGNARGV